MFTILLTAVVAYCIGHHCGELYTRNKIQLHLSEVEQSLLIFYRQQPIMVAVSVIQIIRGRLLTPARRAARSTQGEEE